MRNLFLILFLLFAVLPVTAHASFEEPAVIEVVDALDGHIVEIDDITTENSLYIRVPDIYPPLLSENSVYYAGLAPPVQWRPPMRTAF